MSDQAITPQPNCLLVTTFGAKPDIAELQTKAIQQAIDSCAADGGGMVKFPKGLYRTGALFLKENVTLHIDRDATLQGSDDYHDYGSGEWIEALLTGHNLSSVCIEGEGVIDGSDCPNPHGEEGFRGPHGMVLDHCRNISISGITIKRSSNWAIYCADCDTGVLTQVTILGGHDGLHTQRCANFTVSNCEFRTGDDSFAGSDNKHFVVIDCQINTSCNGFRTGCDDLTVKRCRFWGPGEYQHKISGRNSMITAFVHFSPVDRKPTKLSGDWHIEDVTIENVDAVYEYDYIDGLWQTGQPVTTIEFSNVTAKGLLYPITIIGDTARQFELTMRNVTLALREGAEQQPLLKARNFHKIELQNTTLCNSGDVPVVVGNDGDIVILQDVKFTPETNQQPYQLEDIKEFEHK
jgi:hypothetical protein